MKNVAKDFEKSRDFLICIDSDGCAMDTMDVKHMRCFAPCLVHEWDLGEYRDDIVRLWRKINLLSRSRDINRFKGLAKILVEINENYTRVDGLDELIYWVQTTDELSEESLREAYERTGCNCMKKALEWSRLVNDSIVMISNSRKSPFEGVEEALKLIKGKADVVIVTASNGQEIRREWEDSGLMEYADLLLSQESGTKEMCLRSLTEHGYEKDHVLMIGDAPADKMAAESAEALFYPVLAYQETESWEEFAEEGLKRFLEGTFAGTYQEEKIKEFYANLDL